jgi:quercetin dioxygenase-like cupin family protein
MHIAMWDEIEGKAVTDPGATGVTIRVLMGENVTAPRFTMRHLEVAPGGSTPYHAHPWEHEVFVLSGHGAVLRKDGETEVGSGHFVYVPPDAEHAFANRGDVPLAFLCVIPAAAFCLR